MIRKSKKLGNKGSTIIEFALIFPIYLLLLFSIIEYSFIFMVRSWMEYSMSDVSRYSKIYAASPQPGLDFKNAFKARVASKNILISPNKLVVTNDLSGTASSAYNQKLEICTLANGSTMSCPASGSCPSGASYVDFSGNGRCDDGLDSFAVGGPGDVVKYRLIYKWDLFTPILSVALGDANGQHVIEAVGVIRNES